MLSLSDALPFIGSNVVSALSEGSLTSQQRTPSEHTMLFILAVKHHSRTEPGNAKVSNCKLLELLSIGMEFFPGLEQAIEITTPPSNSKNTAPMSPKAENVF